MRALRRALVSLVVAVVAMVIVRLRGNGGTPPRRGGWRKLTPEELAAADMTGPALPDDDTIRAGSAPAAGEVA